MIQFSPRRGFTTVEAALALVIGLIATVGSVLLYNLLADNAADVRARRRVQLAATVIEKYAAEHHGQYPTSRLAGGPFSVHWALSQQADKNVSPWGGFMGTGSGIPDDGVSELEPVDFGYTEIPPAASVNVPMSGDVSNAANLCYVTPSVKAKPWGGLSATSRPSFVVFKNYAVGICDKSGVPWWDVTGGK